MPGTSPEDAAAAKPGSQLCSAAHAQAAARHTLLSAPRFDNDLMHRAGKWNGRSMYCRELHDCVMDRTKMLPCWQDVCDCSPRYSVTLEVSGDKAGTHATCRHMHMPSSLANRSLDDHLVLILAIRLHSDFGIAA